MFSGCTKWAFRQICQNRLHRSAARTNIYEKISVISSVIRQKGESQNGYFKKTKYAKFSDKTNISYPLICTRTCLYQRVRNVRFARKFGVLCFFETPALGFALLPCPLIRTRRCLYQGVRNVRFAGKFGVLCFFETPVLRFVLLPKRFLRSCQRFMT